jgi:hypothetical protein
MFVMPSIKREGQTMLNMCMEQCEGVYLMNEIERLREALKQYRDGHYSGYVTLPCGWDDEGTLASYALKGFDVATYVKDCEKAYAKLKEDE